MRKYIAIIIASLALFAGQAHAQRCLPNMQGIELRANMADGFNPGGNSGGYSFGAALSTYTKRGNKWVFGGEYLLKNNPYKDGKGKKGGQAMNETAYQTLIVKFSEPITVLDGIFDDAEAWGVDTLKGWIDSYESTRFTATDSHTAVITSEYNMECVKEWLQRQTPIAGITEF